ncbi:hypothetical protein BDV06DRAFT_213230 [Aspergillus oleicola]
MVQVICHDMTPTVLIAQLTKLSSRLSDDGDAEAKRECLRLSKKLSTQLEPPENTAIDTAFSPIVASTARIAVDLKLFELIVEHGPVSATKLAEMSGAEELLIVHFVEEPSPQTYTATNTTRSMATKEIAAGYRVISETAVPAMQAAPTFFRTNGYSCPIDPKDGLTQVASGTEKTMFEYVASRPDLLSDFNLYMGSGMGARRGWLEWFPVQREILDGAEKGEGNVLIVDVGAGKGHDLLAFQGMFPGAGRLVLQDLPAVTDSLIMNGTAIETMAHDFFTEQPVKGARVYFYHHIFHDWSDEYCESILKMLIPATTPGYSRLIINEMILPEQGATQFQAQMDLAMMAFNGGTERTRTQWKTLLEQAGLTHIKFWEPVDEGGDGIIEAMRFSKSRCG